MMKHIVFELHFLSQQFICTHMEQPIGVVCTKVGNLCPELITFG
jgi:hypothetical protein